MPDTAMIDAAMMETLIKLMAAWLLLALVALWAHRGELGLSRRMLIASLHGLVQLLALAFVLHWIFDITARAAQAALIAAFCLLAAHNSASHFDHRWQSWMASWAGLLAATLVTLPWLSISGVIGDDTRTLIPLGSMIAANGMNAISIMLERLKSGGRVGEGVRMAMIPTVDTLRLVGLVHMPGIFVGMILAGASAMDAAVAQVTILYMIVASSFTACMVTFLLLNHLNKAQTGAKEQDN